MTAPRDDDLTATLERERAFWETRYASFEQDPLTHSAQTFYDSITPAYERGGSPRGLVHRRALEIVLAEGLEGKTVLDYCCGRGKWSMQLASQGARVFGFDLSRSGIEYAKRRAAHNRLNAEFVVANASELPYADETFDLLVGISALEHVIKYPSTGKEAHRVLKPGGLAVFTENLGHNPVFNLARRRTMRGEKDAGDILLTETLVRDWASAFASATIEGHSLLFMAKRVVSGRSHLARGLLRGLHQCDEALFRVAPSLRRFGGECVITLRA